MDNKTYQRQKVAEYFDPSIPRCVCNMGSNDDGAHLGRDFGAVNVDIQEYDPHTTNKNLTTLPNYVNSDIRHTPFKDKAFDVAVIGEVLEHCKRQAALDILNEARRIAKYVVVTIPFDSGHSGNRLILLA